MKANEIVSMIAQAIMPREEDRIRGKNSSLLSDELESILAPYRKARMKDFLTACSTGPRTDFLTAQAVSVLDRLCTEKADVFRRQSEGRYAVCLYAHDEPTFLVNLEEGPGRSSAEIIYDGDSYALCMDTDAFGALMDNIHLLPESIMSEVVRDHFRECLPPDLQDRFLSAELTSGCANSCWGDGSYTFGIEAKLKFNDELDLVFAFTLEGSRPPCSIMDDVSYTLSILRKMETKAGGMIPLASCQLGDTGVSLMTPLISGDRGVSDPLHYCLRQFASSNQSRWFIEKEDNHIRAYLTGRPEYERTTFVCITSGCPPRVWQRILSDRNGWGDFFSVWNNRAEESIALVQRETLI